jgi:hypothetical protein
MLIIINNRAKEHAVDVSRRLEGFGVFLVL